MDGNIKCGYSFSEYEEYFGTKFFFIYCNFVPRASSVQTVGRQKEYVTSSHIYDVICEVKILTNHYVFKFYIIFNENSIFCLFSCVLFHM